MISSAGGGYATELDPAPHGTVSMCRIAGAAYAVLTTTPHPLVFDLDGTVLRTDSLIEAALRLAATRPLTLLRLLPTLFSGRAAFKHAVAAARHARSCNARL